MQDVPDEIWALFESFAVNDTDDQPCQDLQCQTCKRSDTIILDDGNYTCKKCGDVVSRFIDAGAEWRYYGFDDSKGVDPTRCGLPMNELLPDSSLGSVIGYSCNETHDIKLMRKYHMWNSMSYKERSLYNVFDTLTVNAVNHGISKSIIDDAKVLYKKISEMKISRGENRNGLIASSIYMSCKRNNAPRSAKEIAKVFNIETTTMTKGCKKFQEIMKLKMKSTRPEDFIARFCSKLEMGMEMRDICKAVVRKAHELGVVSENTPPSIAAGTIYLCNINYNWGISKKDLSENCEISQVTISKCYKKMEAYKHLLISKTSQP
jgi:transcription initiation factor TFIIB